MDEHTDSKVEDAYRQGWHDALEELRKQVIKINFHD
jgi:hypothetical protein